MDVSIFSIWSPYGLIADCVILLIMILFVIQGAKNGFLYVVLCLLSLVAGILSASLVSNWLTDPLSNLIYGSAKESIESVGTLPPDLARRGIRYAVQLITLIVTFFLVLFLLRLFAKWLSEKVSELSFVGTVDSSLGAALNCIVGLAVVFLAQYTWQYLWPESFEKVINGAPLMTLVKNINPLFEFLKELKL